MTDRTTGPLQILLVEDNLADADLMKEALEECCIENIVHVARDGEQAMDFLYRRGGFGDAPRPDFMILDLNLPKKDGREVLTEIKRNEALMSIPIIVVTTSQSEADIAHTYKLHANSFVRKPRDLNQLFDVVRRIEEFWFQAASLPPREE